MEEVRFFRSFTGHITLIIWILWNKIRISRKGDAAYQLLKKRNKQMSIERQSAVIILMTVHFHCHPLRKAKWLGWLGFANNGIETSTLFTVLLSTVFCFFFCWMTCSCMGLFFWLSPRKYRFSISNFMFGFSN